MPIIVIVLIVVVVWLVAGAVSNNVAPTPTLDSNPRVECVVCDKLDAWWSSLDGFGKFVGAAWYAINKAACLIKGCKSKSG